MKKNQEIYTMLKEAGILFAITLLAGFFLGIVYEITREPRQMQQERVVQEACVAVFPKAAAQGAELVFEAIDYAPESHVSANLADNFVTVGQVYKAINKKDGNQLYGYVVESASAKGYGGEIVLYVGVSVDGTVCGVSITEISETPGLGMEATTVLVPQFADKRVEQFSFTKTGATADYEVDAITSATITTRAVTNAVNGGLLVAGELLEGGAANE